MSVKVKTKAADLKPTEIAASRWVLREFPYSNAALARLAKSVRKHGVLTRLRVFVNEEGEYELIAGHRRLAAAMEAGLEFVPVDIVECDGDVNGFLPTAREEALIDNLEREDLSPIEVAKAVKQMMDDYGYSQAQLARRIGKSGGYIASKVALLRLVPSLQDGVHRGEIDVSVGLALSQAGARVQEQMLRRLGDQAKHHAAAATVRQMLSEGLECREQVWITPMRAGRMLGRRRDEIVELCKAGALRHKRQVKWLVDKEDVERYGKDRVREEEREE